MKTNISNTSSLKTDFASFDAISAKNMIKHMFIKRDHEFEKLVQLDIERKEIMDHNKNIFLFYFSMKGKSIFLSFIHPYFFITCVVYVVFRYLIHNEPNNYNTSTTSTMAMASGLMSFLLVFYLQQTYSRYLEQYKAIVVVQDRIQEIFTFGRFHLSHDVLLTLWRYVNATHLLAYTSLSSHYNRENFFEPINAKYLLLTPEEDSLIFEEHNDESFRDARITYTWCIDLIANQFKNSKIVLSEELVLFNLLNQFKSSLFILFSFRDNPIPISYAHFVKVMEAIYLPILAYTFATIKDMYQLGVVHEVITASSLFIITLFFIGLIKLTDKFQDPFGEDIEDFRVLNFLEQSAKTSANIIITPRSVNNEEQERELWESRIGYLKETKPPAMKKTSSSTGYLFNFLAPSAISPGTENIQLDEKISSMA